jgi:hypothetical protein
MMDQVQLEWFATLGVGGIVAGFMFLFYRRDMKQFTQQWIEESKLNRETLNQVMSVVRDNTIALTKVLTTIDSLHRRLDGVRTAPQRD